MDKFQLQKLRDLPIEGVAQRLGLQVSRHKCLCPFHDDHNPSLSFSRKRNTYRCFVCGASGGTIDLVMRYLNKDFLEACRWLADEHNIIIDQWKPEGATTPLSPWRGVGGEASWRGVGGEAEPFDASRYERFFERPFLNDEARRFLFDERRLDPRVVRWCRLTSWRDRQGTPWLQTPYYDREGRLVGVQNRNLASPNPSEGGGYLPRFRFPQGSQCGIYNLPVLNRLKPGEALYITEGCSDCWAMLSAGHKAIAIPSATLLKRKDAELLEALSQTLATHFHMFPDRDEPGERLFLQLQQVLPRLEHHQLPPECKDFGEYYARNVARSDLKSDRPNMSICNAEKTD